MGKSKLVDDIRKENAKISNENQKKLKALYEEHIRKVGELNAETETEQHRVLEECEEDDSK